jgi:hypothetical protein
MVCLLPLGGIATLCTWGEGLYTDGSGELRFGGGANCEVPTL